jgi:sugar phosphate isomerase/epimerase
MNTLLISGFADEISSDFSKQIQELNKLGIDYMSIRGVDGRNIGDYTLEEIRTNIQPRLEAGKIKISSIGSPIGKIDVEDEEAFEQQKIMLVRLCQACKFFECDYIRIFSFFIPQGKNPDEFKEVVIRKMQEFVTIAEEYDVVLLHENEKDIYGDIGRRCKDLLDAIDSPNFKGIFDFANFVQCQEDTRICYELLKDDTVYIHIKDAVYTDGDNVLCGTGDGKIQELLADFIAEGYEGFLTLEPHLVIFDSLKDLENKDSAEVIKSNKAKSGEEGFEMQYRALEEILKTIQGDV